MGDRCGRRESDPLPHLLWLTRTFSNSRVRAPALALSERGIQGRGAQKRRQLVRAVATRLARYGRNSVSRSDGPQPKRRVPALRHAFSHVAGGYNFTWGDPVADDRGSSSAAVAKTRLRHAGEAGCDDHNAASSIRTSERATFFDWRRSWVARSSLMLRRPSVRR